MQSSGPFSVVGDRLICHLGVIEDCPEEVGKAGQQHQLHQRGVMPLAHGLWGFPVRLADVHVWMPPLCPCHTRRVPMQEERCYLSHPTPHQNGGLWSAKLSPITAERRVLQDAAGVLEKGSRKFKYGTLLCWSGKSSKCGHTPCPKSGRQGSSCAHTAWSAPSVWTRSLTLFALHEKLISSADKLNILYETRLASTSCRYIEIIHKSAGGIT